MQNLSAMGNPVQQVDPEEVHRQLVQDAFDVAIANNDLQPLQQLINSDLINVSDKNKFLYLAIIQENLAIVEMLMTGCADVDPQNPNIHLLHQAIRIDDPTLRWGMVKLLVKPNVSIRNEGKVVFECPDGTKITKNGSYSCSCVHEAVYQGDYELVKYLVIAGSDVNFVDHEGYTPLHAAIQLLDGQKRIDMVEQLIKIGADVHLVGPNGLTCMHYLSLREPESRALGGLRFNDHQSDADLVKILFDAGAKVNVIDDSGYTPLHLAIRFLKGSARLVMVKQLLEFGADANIMGPRGHTCLDLVAGKKSGIPELILMLVDAGAQLDSALEDNDIQFGAALLYRDFQMMEAQMMEVDESA